MDTVTAPSAWRASLPVSIVTIRPPPISNVLRIGCCNIIFRSLKFEVQNGYTQTICRYYFVTGAVSLTLTFGEQTPSLLHSSAFGVVTGQLSGNLAARNRFIQKTDIPNILGEVGNNQLYKILGF